MLVAGPHCENRLQVNLWKPFGLRFVSQPSLATLQCNIEGYRFWRDLDERLIP